MGEVTLNETIQSLESDGQFKVLRRVPEFLNQQSNAQGRQFTAAFIDLETTGLDAKADEIIEIGTLIVSFTNEEGFTSLQFSDNQLQEPKTPISAEITQITGITNEDVKGKAINWQALEQALTPVDLIICHNASFDRNFMELQTPSHFSEMIQTKAFACSARDVGWRDFGFESAKLEYLNFKLGCFYEGHRALIDCWATLNLFIQQPDAFTKLKQSVKQKENLICATGAPFDKKDLLKQRGYRWSDGNGALPKAWWTIISLDTTESEIAYLEAEIYNGRSIDLPTKQITARSRYSFRSMELAS